jgi:NADPH:quinone reductase-like Zn-dependent oxidoreductase
MEQSLFLALWERSRSRSERSATVTPIIDRTYPLSETPEAGYVEAGHARGKVVITV